MATAALLTPPGTAGGPTAAARPAADVRAPEARARYARMRAEIEAEKPALRDELFADLVADLTGAGVPSGEALVALKALRESAGVSLTDLAARAGMQKSSLSRLENEDRNPTVRTLERLAAALGKRLVVRLEDLPDETANDGMTNAEAPGEPADE